MFIVDAHLDLSMNAMEWNRDIRQPLDVINELEGDLNDKPGRGKATVSFSELRKGNIALVVATQIARYSAPGNPLPGWNSPHQAWAQTQAQFAWYREMEKDGELKMICNRQQLDAHLAQWEHSNNEKKPIGYLLSLEGADSLITPDHLRIAYDYGLRAVGPAHYGPGRYANGTDSSGKMSQSGFQLLKEMEELNMILDATHLCDDTFFDAINFYNGPVWASHNNVRSIVDHNRQFTDQQIRMLIDKGAVIGAALDAWMIVPNWIRGVSAPKAMLCSLQSLFKHIDHICQLAGSTLHVGIGSDLDGGFGSEQTPYDIHSIADLQKLSTIFDEHGYTKEDIKNIMNRNWIRFLQQHLPLS